MKNDNEFLVHYFLIIFDVKTEVLFSRLAILVNPLIVNRYNDIKRRWKFSMKNSFGLLKPTLLLTDVSKSFLNEVELVAEQPTRQSVTGLCVCATNV